MPTTPTCHHILASGALCQAPALRNRNYCRFHLDQIGRRMRAAQARARHRQPVFKLPLIEDLFSVQVAILQVADALINREIELSYARQVTTMLRLAMQGFKNKQLREQPQCQLALLCAGAPTAWDTFEQEYDLPAGLDLSLDPEVAFPPPAVEPVPQNLPRAGLAIGDLPLGANPGVAGAHYVAHQGVCDRDGQPIEPSDSVEAGPKLPCRVTADQVEIADVLDREGRDAMYKVIAQQERTRKRRERQIRRLYYEEAARNHSIKLSVEKMVVEQKKAEAARAQKASSEPGRVLSAVEEAYAAVEKRLAEVNRKPPQSEAAPATSKDAAGDAATGT